MNEKSVFSKKIRQLSSDCFPICSAIEVTNRCNAKCGYCYIDQSSTGKELSTQQMCFVIDKLSASGIMFLNITGGEPFIRDDINEILEHCFKAGFFSISIYSNGTLLDKSHIDLLSKYNNQIHPFRMTVFSQHEEIHDAYMKIPGSFRTIIKTGQLLLDNNVEVKLAIPIMDFNAAEINESMDFFRNLGFPIGWNPMKVITETNDTPHLRSMITEQFYRDIFIHNSCRIREDNEYSDELCRGLRETVMIDIHGDIHPCTVFRNFSVGSILNELPLNEILTKNKQYLFLKSLTKNDLPCGKCEYRNICTPCMAQWHNLNGSFSAPHPEYCNINRAYRALFEKKEPDEKLYASSSI